MANYSFFITNVNTPWDDLIIFDIETVENIEKMREVVLKNEINLEYLDVRNAKYIAFAINAKYPKLHIKGFRSRLVSNWRIYYNVEKITYEEMALTLLEIAFKLNLKGFCAHNGNKFDFLIFLHAGFKLINKKGSLTLRVNNKYFKLIDTLKIGRSCSALSLEQLARTFKVEGKNLKEADNIYEYVINDVVILTRIIEKFKKLGIEGTPTRTGRKYIYEIMKQRNIKRIKSEINFPLDYIGGRVETFWHYAKKGHVYDANSLYPSVMANFLFPKLEKNKIKVIDVSNKFAYELIESQNKEVLKHLNDFTPFNFKNAFEKVWKNLHVLVHVKIKGVRKEYKKFEKIFLKYFPFSYVDRKNRRIFKLTNNEIYQIQSYEVLWLIFYDYEIVKAKVFYVEPYIFSELYKTLYRDRKILKQKGDMRQLLLKIVMNSSYGIMGLRDPFIKEITKQEALSLLYENKNYVEFIKQKTRFGHKGVEFVFKISNNRIFITNDNKAYYWGKKFSFMSVPLWATTITSHARFWLQCVIFSLAFRGFKIFYCDTDSVFTDCDQSEFSKLNILGSDMLEWKHEYSFEDGYFFAPKTYIIKTNGETKIKAKGIGANIFRKIVVQSEKNPIPRIMFKRIFNPDIAPKKIPDNNFESVYNIDNIKFYDAFKNIFSLFSRDYPELYSQIREYVFA